MKSFISLISINANIQYQKFYKKKTVNIIDNIFQIKQVLQK